jgi:hypothetical protein
LKQPLNSIKLVPIGLYLFLPFLVFDSTGNAENFIHEKPIRRKISPQFIKPFLTTGWYHQKPVRVKAAFPNGLAILLKGI